MHSRPPRPIEEGLVYSRVTFDIEDVESARHVTISCIRAQCPPGGYTHLRATHTSGVYGTDGDVRRARNIAIHAHRNLIADQLGLQRVYGGGA